MSTNLHMYIERYNRKNKEWDALIPTVMTRDYHDNLKEEKVFFWKYNGTHEIFEILRREGGFDPKYGVPNDLSAEVKAIYDKDFPKGGDFTGCYGASYTSLSALYIYYLENKKVPDYDADWGEGGKDRKYMTNPIWDILESAVLS